MTQDRSGRSLLFYFVECEVRTVLRYFNSKKIKDQNPKYVLSTTLVDDFSSPVLQTTYMDGSTKSFCLDQPIDSLIMDMHKYNLVLDKKGVQLPLDADS